MLVGLPALARTCGLPYNELARLQYDELACTAALKRCGALPIWFETETAGLAAPGAKRGGAAAFPAAAIRAGLRLKGEGRPASHPVERFRLQPAPPGGGSGWHCDQPPGWRPAC